MSLSVAMAVKDPQSRSPGARYTPEPEPVAGEWRTGCQAARTQHFKFLEYYSTIIDKQTFTLSALPSQKIVGQKDPKIMLLVTQEA